MKDSKKTKELAHKFALDKKMKLFPLRIKCWMSKTHAYQCGVYDGFLEGHSLMEDEVRGLEDNYFSIIINAIKAEQRLYPKTDYSFHLQVAIDFLSENKEAMRSQAGGGE